MHGVIYDHAFDEFVLDSAGGEIHSTSFELEMNHTVLRQVVFVNCRFRSTSGAEVALLEPCELRECQVDGVVFSKLYDADVWGVSDEE